MMDGSRSAVEKFPMTENGLDTVSIHKKEIQNCICPHQNLKAHLNSQEGVNCLSPVILNSLYSPSSLFKDIKAVKDKKLKKDKLAKDTLGIVNLFTQKVEKIPNVQSFKSPEKGGAWMAYLMENMKDKTATPDAKDDDADDKKDDDANTKPSDLILVNLLTGKKRPMKM